MTGGRPRSDNPSPKTRANRASMERAQLLQAAFDAGLPEYLQFERRIESEVERIFSYTPGWVRPLLGLQEIGALARNHRGTWQLYDGGRSSQQRLVMSIVAILKTARNRAHRGKAALGDESIVATAKKRMEQAGIDWLTYAATFHRSREDNDIHWRQVAATVIDQLELREEPVMLGELHTMSKRPLIPLASMAGGAWDIASETAIDADAFAGEYYVENGWGIPLPDMGILNRDDPQTRLIRNVLANRWGELADRAASLITFGPRKVVDVIIAELSNWGKSTFIDVLMLAFPGMIAKVPLARAEKRFGEVGPALAKKAIVFIEEAAQSTGDSPFLTPGLLHTWTDENILYEKKGEQGDPSVIRSGTVVFLSLIHI